jgi:hypothetical protein
MKIGGSSSYERNPNELQRLADAGDAVGRQYDRGDCERHRFDASRGHRAAVVSTAAVTAAECLAWLPIYR